MLGREAVDVGYRVRATDKHMAGVHADAEARIIEGRHETDELLIRAEHLRSLPSGGLQQNGTGLRSELHGMKNIRAHVGQCGVRVLCRVLTNMDNNSVRTNGYARLKILDE